MTEEAKAVQKRAEEAGIPDFFLPATSLSPIFADFPDPVLITNAHRQVIFLNCAAQKLFGATLKTGDPCPICGEQALFSGLGEESARLMRCRPPGESLRQVPVLLKTRWPLGAPLSVSATPIQGEPGRSAGCFIIVREHGELMTHPVLDQQIATLSS